MSERLLREGETFESRRAGKIMLGVLAVEATATAAGTGVLANTYDLKAAAVGALVGFGAVIGSAIHFHQRNESNLHQNESRVQ